MNYNIKTIRDALSAACGVSQELMHDALAALAKLERAAKEPIGELTNAGTVHEHPFTVFYSSKLPIGTKLYTTPPPAQPATGMPEWYGEGTPWPLHEVLAKLTNATGILLDRLDYDGHGHEGIRYAQIAGKEILAKITQERTK